jgi:hypothetical protein
MVANRERRRYESCMGLIDEAAIERRCMDVLRRADRGRHTSPTPCSDEHLARASMLAALGWMYVDLERAVVELETLVSRRNVEGQILRAADGGAALPLLASVMRMIYHAARGRKSPLEARLAALIPAVDDHHRWIEEHSTQRLYQPTPADERVTDPAIGETAAWGEIGFNALLVQAESDLADISIHANRPTRRMIAGRLYVAQALAERRWRSDLALFAPQASTHAEVCAEGALPLWAGTALRGQAADLVERHLSVGGRLWAPYPLLVSAPVAGPSAEEGRLCPLLNWLLVRGLYRYGFAEQTRAVNDAFLERVAVQGCWEWFSATTGEGQGEPESVATAVLALDLAKTPYHYFRW